MNSPVSHYKETPGFWSRKSSWLVFPLAPITLIHLYYAFGIVAVFMRPDYYLQSLDHIFAVLVSPSFCTLMVGIFGLLYIYKAIKGSPHIIAQIIGWIYVAISVIALGYVFLGVAGECPSFFGGRAPCSDMRLLTVSLLYFQEISMIVWEILAAIGIAMLLFLKRRN